MRWKRTKPANNCTSRSRREKTKGRVRERRGAREREESGQPTVDFGQRLRVGVRRPQRKVRGQLQKHGNVLGVAALLTTPHHTAPHHTHHIGHHITPHHTHHLTTPHHHSTPDTTPQHETPHHTAPSPQSTARHAVPSHSRPHHHTARMYTRAHHTTLASRCLII